MYLNMVYTYDTFDILLGRKEIEGHVFVYYYRRGDREAPALTDSYREFWL
jgi:hypothetical protein